MRDEGGEEERSRGCVLDAARVLGRNGHSTLLCSGGIGIYGKIETLFVQISLTLPFWFVSND